jgi:hypothetical protein
MYEEVRGTCPGLVFWLWGWDWCLTGLRLLLRAFVHPQIKWMNEINECGAHGRMILTVKPKNSEKTLSQCHFVHHKSHWIYVGANLGCRGERLATYRLSHGTAISCPGQSMWDLWWTKWHWDRSFSESFGFLLSVSFYHCSIFTYLSSGG